MRYYIIIPAHNEGDNIRQALESIVTQTLLPKQVVVVDDSSTDNTYNISQEFASKYEYINVVQKNSKSNVHLPGSKVIEAFYEGYKTLDDNYDVIMKLDADIILQQNYLEGITQLFESDNRIGMAGGFAYILKDGKWVYENLANDDHVRGPFKAYRKACFEDIGKLKPTMGWDTVDELLAQYHGWKIKTDHSLKNKHLKPTGNAYSKAAKYKQGAAFYKLRYGFVLTVIASLKLALLKNKPLLFIDYVIGYFKAKKEGIPLLLNEEEGIFVRKHRWKGIKKRLLKK